MTRERLAEITEAAIQQGATAEALEILELAYWALQEKAAAKQRLDRHRERQRAQRVPKKRGRPRTMGELRDFYAALGAADTGRTGA